MQPSFLICGAGKSGTTALWAVLKDHPQICMAKIKEPRFFTNHVGQDRGGPADADQNSGRFDYGWDWYESLFEDCGSSQILGEASTAYLRCEDAAGMIHKHVPTAKLIFILRSPVDRLYSHYWEEKKMGWKLPSFESLVAENHPFFQKYCRVSRYKANLERYLALFPREQLLILTHDDFKSNPQALVKTVLVFLGVDTDVELPGLGRQVNPSGMPRWITLQRLMARTYGFRQRHKLPKWLLNILIATRETIVKLNRRTGRYPKLNPELRREFNQKFEEDIAFLEDQLSRDLSHWRTA